MYQNIVYAHVTHRNGDNEWQVTLVMSVGESKEKIPYTELIAAIDKQNLTDFLRVQPSDICFITKEEYEAEYGEDEEEDDDLGLYN